MGMENFDPAFQTPEHYIIDITYRIWEQQGVGLIRDWYAPNCPVRTPGGVSNSSDDVVRDTLAYQQVFPHRELLAEDVIIGDKPSGFYSSHRVRGVGRHSDDGYYGPATGRLVTTLAIADCVCRDNRIVEEWVLGNQAALVRQLGLDPVAYGHEMGRNDPVTFAIGINAMRQRWAAPEGLTIVGDGTIAQRLLDSYDAIWNNKNLQIMNTQYDRAVRLEAPDGVVSHGRTCVADMFTAILSSIPDGQFEVYHIIVQQHGDRAVRVAVRWSYCGTHAGFGRYGVPTGAPVAVLGISHLELRAGLIAQEWMVVDETAIYAQIAAYQAAAVPVAG